ncbi:glutamate--cysteine ligase [Saccharomonospora sp. NPDC046836]|uniref:glutamate--cysteine ligase n=1 Tax=Saccharomonospora sp. NPDC046836 TaxID=3156921 RepID=UPI0033DFD2A8
MGEDVEQRTFTRADRTRYRVRVRRCLDAFARMLQGPYFTFDRPLTGVEIELNLVDAADEPAMCNNRVLEAIANPAFQTELGQWNLEVNMAPRQLAGRGTGAFERDVRASLNAAETKAQAVGAHLIMIGILPTLRAEHLTGAALSGNPRYGLLNQQILTARGEDVQIAIEGTERLQATSDTIVPEAACTSTQFHLQVSPARFPAFWNAAQAIAGVQVAVGANAPFLLGKQLWQETRVALFEQATDTRSEELKAQGVRPRVWFGERWITSIFDLFEENVRYFSALLPICSEEDPMEVLDRGDIPELAELRLHNGTIYRWNRPVYAVVRDRPHLRVENRVLPAGPTVADTLANGAFYFGLVRALADDDRPVWTEMSFGVAQENFHAAARRGIDTSLYWPGVGTVPVRELILRRLLPLADEGLRRWDVESAERDRLLGIVEQRCLTGVTGAGWQIREFHRLYDTTSLSRREALRRMVREYRTHMHTNEPVHTWPQRRGASADT